MTLLVLLDHETAGHVVIALREHRARLRELGYAIPQQVDDLEQHVAALLSAPVASNGDTLPDGLREAASVDRMVTIAQAARRLGLSERTVERRVRSGEIPSVKIGGSRRIAQAELRRLQEDQ